MNESKSGIKRNLGLTAAAIATLAISGSSNQPKTLPLQNSAYIQSGDSNDRTQAMAQLEKAIDELLISLPSVKKQLAVSLLGNPLKKDDAVKISFIPPCDGFDGECNISTKYKPSKPLVNLPQVVELFQCYQSVNAQHSSGNYQLMGRSEFLELIKQRFEHLPAEMKPLTSDLKLMMDWMEDPLVLANAYVSSSANKQSKTRIAQTETLKRLLSEERPYVVVPALASVYFAGSGGDVFIPISLFSELPADSDMLSTGFGKKVFEEVMQADISSVMKSTNHSVGLTIAGVVDLPIDIEVINPRYRKVVTSNVPSR